MGALGDNGGVPGYDKGGESALAAAFVHTSLYLMSDMNALSKHCGGILFACANASATSTTFSGAGTAP